MITKEEYYALKPGDKLIMIEDYLGVKKNDIVIFDSYLFSYYNDGVCIIGSTPNSECMHISILRLKLSTNNKWETKQWRIS